MSNYTLEGTIRTVLGKQVKSIRNSGSIPATVYGKGIQPISCSVSMHDFTKLYAEAGETGLITLTIAGHAHPVLVHTVQLDPIKETYLHIEFHEVNLKEKVHADIPIEFTGEPSAVKEKVGMFMSLLDHIEVEALPNELPERISLDVSQLAALNDQIVVGDIKVSSGVTIITDPTIIIAKIGAFIVEKEPEPTPEAAPVATEGEQPAGETAKPEEAPAASEEKK